MNNRQFRISGTYLRIPGAASDHLRLAICEKWSMENLYTYEQFRTVVEDGG